MSREPTPQLYLAMIAVVIAIGWLVPTGHSLWLDETGTYWIVKDGLRDVVARSYYWTNWSPYYLVAWLAAQVGGSSEVILRLPSVLAMAAAAYFVFRIGARIGDAETGLLAAGLFVMLHEVCFSAADARPYAFTLMTLTAYTLALLRWVDRPGIGIGATVVVLAALTAYGHIVLALGLVVPAVFALWRTTRRLPLLGLGLATGILLVPLALQLRDYAAMDTVHMFAERPTLPDFLDALASSQVFAALLLGIAAARIVAPRVRSVWPPMRAEVVLVAAWLAFAPAVLFLLGRTTSIQLFVPRYLLSTAPACALLLACFLRTFRPAAARQTIIGVMMALSLLGWVFSSAFRHGEDWRGAMAAVQEAAAGTSTPLVLVSCFIEAQSLRDLDDPRLAEVLFAPTAIYPPGTRTVRLPYVLDEAVAAGVLHGDLARHTEFLLLTCGENETVQWFESAAPPAGFVREHLGLFRGLELRRFVATMPAAPDRP